MRVRKRVPASALIAAIVTGASLVGFVAQPAAAAVANTVVYQEKTYGYDCFRIPAVVKANNGDPLAFAEARLGGDKFCSDKTDIDIVVKRSSDNGKTSSAPKIVIEGFGDTKGNPTVIVNPATGLQLHLAF